ncbi:MAG: LamG domain-containing protein, partial [Lentisphaeria bacterium]|nr:LamG domain-containing protein [Lentisphaeria bacterium]
MFHADFDKDFRVVTQGKIETGRHSVPINMETLSMLLQSGVKGQAAKIGTQMVNGKKEHAFIHYSGKAVKAVNAEQGTVSFWFKPLNWSFRDRKYHAILQCYDADGSLFIHKHKANSRISVYYGSTRRGKNSVGYSSFSSANLTWDAGEFRHIAVTWDKNSIALYLDGIRAGNMKMASKAPFKNFTLISPGFISVNGYYDEAGESLMDDLRIYDRALTGIEVENLFSSYGVKKLDKSSIPVKFQTAKLLASPDSKKIDLTFSLTRTTMKGTGFPVEMELLKNGKSVLKKVLDSSTTDYAYALDLAQWKKGDYQIFLRPVREAKTDKIENKKLIFTIADYKPIVDHSVPEPWKPVTFKNGQLSAVMQKTVFGSKGVFPQQLFSEKTPLLRGDMRFVLDGKNISGKAVSKVIEKHPDYQIVERKVAGKGFDLVSRMRFEFDGMMWFDVTLKPKGKLKIKNAKIQLPLRKETSTLYNCFVRDYFSLSGHFAGKLVKPVKRNHYDTGSNGKLPVLWMGNEERGLYYFTADQAGRRLKNRAETVRLDPGKEGALFTINLIDYASVLDKPVTW